MKRYILAFKDGSKEQSELLGGKGANLAEMTKLGLPVPTGFTITTEACLNYLEEGTGLSYKLQKQIQEHIELMEKKTNKRMGGIENPLLVSVRSGAKFSMPGMMDTILNLGLNDETVVGLAEKSKNSCFAYDCYRRLLQMFGDVVCGIDKDRFEEQLSFYKKKNNYQFDQEMKAEDWQTIVKIYKDIFLEITHKPFPQSPLEQLYQAIEAVFRSWNNRRAFTYRKLNNIPDNLGTAVNIQAMVFGNFGNSSGTGVAFTRNPVTGEKEVFGEFLLNAQGEDVVAGVRTPEPIGNLAKHMPKVYQQFLKVSHLLEQHYKDMQDIEFTVEDEQLFLLQTRNGKRTAKAGFKICIQLVEEGIVSKKEALKRITPTMVEQLLHPVFDENELANSKIYAKGLPASPGAASGKIYFSAEEAKKASEGGDKVILIRQETSPEDIEGMVVSEAIVTSRGGMTSHAAVVARGMGVCCVVGCEELEVNEFMQEMVFNGRKLKQGDSISVDGSTGIIYEGVISSKEGNNQALLEKILQWASEKMTFGVRANAETPKDIETAIRYGAQGIGLARTEHMFFGEKRIFHMRKMILTEKKEERLKALSKLKEYQKADFRQMFLLLKGKPCTIRLLDPPLHEFLPQTANEIHLLAKEMNCSVNEINHRIAELHEQNPMLGQRGCRLAITMPEIYEMQVRAIFETVLEMIGETGAEIIPEIMIPLISSHEEMHWLRERLKKSINELLSKENHQLAYKIGTMLEIPRACLTADKIAEYADFFSFGTNDLTQLTYGFSRDDSGKFMDAYLDKKLLKQDPFQHLDEDGVGSLMKIAVEKVKKFDKNLKIGICGEVGGDPQSIEFLRGLGIDYISCSPYRVPASILTIANITDF